MKRLKKSLTVPTIIVCTLGWTWFYSQAIEESNKDGTKESSDVIKRIDEIKKNSIAYQIDSSFSDIQKKSERLKEEERKRLNELERQRLERLEHIRLEKERIAKIEKQKRLEEKKKRQVVSRGNEGVTDWMDYQFTHYTANCQEGCSGYSATGDYLGGSKYYQGYRVIAAPKNIPFYSIIRIQYPDGTQFDSIVLDRGGAIKNQLLDVLVSTEDEARKLGRVNGKIKILRYGKGS